jgi:hypothetical protein
MKRKPAKSKHDAAWIVLLTNERNRLERRCEAAESALKVLHTWATFRGGSTLSPLSVSILCKRTLEENRL